MSSMQSAMATTVVMSHIRAFLSTSNKLLMSSGFIRIFPYIHNTRGRVEPVEHHEGQTHVSQYRPQYFSVKIVTLVEQIVRLDLESLRYPHRHVANNEESQQLSSRLLFLEFCAVAASSQAVDNHGSLDEHLDDLKIRVLYFYGVCESCESILR